jgi:hypothetical protein
VPIAAAPIAATPAARAAFLATRPTFGRRAFFAVPDRFALVVFSFVSDLFAPVVFLVFDLVLARFNEDLALVRLTLLFMHFLPIGGQPASI